MGYAFEHWADMKHANTMGLVELQADCLQARLARDEWPAPVTRVDAASTPPRLSAA